MRYTHKIQAALLAAVAAGLSANKAHAVSVFSDPLNYTAGGETAFDAAGWTEGNGQGSGYAVPQGVLNDVDPTNGGPVLASVNANYLSLGNEDVFHSLGTTLTGDWSVSVNVLQTSYARGAGFALLGPTGNGYGVIWDSAVSGSWSNGGYLNMTKLTGVNGSWPDWAGAGVLSVLPNGYYGSNRTDVNGFDSSNNFTGWEHITLGYTLATNTLNLSLTSNAGTVSYSQPDSTYTSFSQVELFGNTNGEFQNLSVLTGPTGWNVDSSGDWNSAANWDLGVPNAVDAKAAFYGAISTARTIYTDAPLTVGALTFNNANSYFVEGSGSITLSSATTASITVLAGNHVIAPAKLEFASNTNLNVASGSILTLGGTTGGVVIDPDITVSETGSGSVTFESALSLQSGAHLNLTSPASIQALSLAASASTTVAAHGTGSDNLLTLNSLSMDPASSLNLSNNESLVHNGNLGTITSSLKAGYNAGKWNGSGISSSNANADTRHLTAMGVFQASGAITVGGQSLQAGDVLVKYTYYGDADLSGSIDGSDYSRIDNGYLSKLTGWQNGDFNYDGVVNGSDYTLIDNAFNTQGARIADAIAAPTAQIAGAAGTSAVPEPTSLTLLGIGVAGLLSRRRKLR